MIFLFLSNLKPQVEFFMTLFYESNDPSEHSNIPY
jgi:hypothetical protein